MQFKVTRGVTRPVWEPDGKVMALYETARGIARGLGYDISSQSSGGGSDGNFTGAMGIATLDGLGVQGAGAHTLDEHIVVESLAYRGKPDGRPAGQLSAERGRSREHGCCGWSWRVVRGGRGCSSACCAGCCRAAAARRISRTTRAILAWDIGVIVFLALSAFLFTTERLDRMAADAEAQEEGEWTIFWLTVAAVTFSFVAVISEFAGTKELPRAQNAICMSSWWR